MKKSKLKELIKEVIREYSEKLVTPHSAWKVDGKNYTLVKDLNRPYDGWVFSSLDGKDIQKFDKNLKDSEVMKKIKKSGAKFQFMLNPKR